MTRREIIERIERLEVFITGAGSVGCKLEADMVCAGWSLRDIEDWSAALEKASQQIHDKPPRHNLTVRDEMEIACQAAVEFVESPTLLALLAEYGYRKSEFQFQERV